MQTSERTNEVMAALVAMQVALTQPVKDERVVVKTKDGGAYGYAYLSLPALFDHITPARREAGLAIAQDVTGDTEGVRWVGVSTVIVHLSGQWMSFGPCIFAAPQDHQARGSAISYARRYALLAALGLAAEDDDGQMASAAPLTTGENEEGSRAGAAGTDGAADAPSGGGAFAALPDARSTQEEFHPGRRHVMVASPTLAGWEYCEGYGSVRCPYAREVAHR